MEHFQRRRRRFVDKQHSLGLRRNVITHNPKSKSLTHIQGHAVANYSYYTQVETICFANACFILFDRCEVFLLLTFYYFQVRLLVMKRDGARKTFLWVFLVLLARVRVYPTIIQTTSNPSDLISTGILTPEK